MRGSTPRYISAPPPPRLPDDVDADLTGDGTVDINDLLFFLGVHACINQGLCDLDGNGLIGVRNLLILLANMECGQECP